MAESFGDIDPDYVIRIRADWSEFDADVQRKADTGGTFGGEVGTPGGFGGRKALPDYSRGAESAERFSRAIERQVQNFERGSIAVQRMPMEQIYIPNNYGLANVPRLGYSGIGGGLVPPGPPGIGGGGGFGGGGGGFAGGGSGGGYGGTPGLVGGGYGPGGTPPGGGGGYYVPIGAGGFGGGGNEPESRSMWSRLSPFYKRFIALEAFRTYASIQYAHREYDIQQQEALGDPTALAQAGLNQYHRLASTVPFGLGMFLEGIADPGGNQEAAIGVSLAQSKLADQRNTLLQGRMETGLRSTESVAVAMSPLGTQRRLTGIQVERDQRVRDIRLQSEKYMTQIASHNLANVSAIENDVTYQQFLGAGFTSANTGIPAIQQHNQLLQNEQNRAARERSRNVTQTQGLISDVNKEATRQSDIVLAQNQIKQFTIGAEGISGQVMSGLSVPGGMGIMSRDFQRTQMQISQRAATAQLQASQSAELMNTQFNNPELVAATQFAQQGARSELQVRQQIETAQQEARWEFESASATIAAGGVIATAQASLSRNPRQAIIESSNAAQRTLNFQLGVQGISPLSQQATTSNEAIVAERNDRLRRFDDQRAIQTLDLKRQEQVTGMLATAYGPGAPLRRMEAFATNISLEAEEKAQGILREDVTNIGNADRERRTGINRLRELQANYLQGFTAQEGNLNRTNLTPTGVTSNPQNVLESINNNIRDLTNKIGTLVATD